MNLPFEAYPQQLEAASYWTDNETEEIAYGGAKYGGKSYLGCNLIIGDALIYPETNFFIARESLNDLRKYTVPSVMEVFQSWGINFADYGKFNGMDNFFQFNNGSRVLLLQAGYMPSDPLFERFGSMQNTRGWIEEAGQVPELAKDNLRASVGRWKNKEYKLPAKCLYTCNPKNPHWLERDFYRPWTKGELPKTRKFVKALPTDNIKGSAEYIDALRRIKDPVMRARLFEGSWDYDNDPARLIEHDAIADLYTNEDVQEGGDKYITADVARYGHDLTVIALWEGLRILHVTVMEKSSVPEVAASITSLSKLEGVARSRIVIDDDGIGGGVVDLLPGCYPFKGGAKPIPVKGQDVNFLNLKAQCYYQLAEHINERELHWTPEGHRDKVTEELAWVKRDKMDMDGKLRILPKEKVKEGIGRSPDFSDVLMMRMVFELRPQLVGSDYLRRKGRRFHREDVKEAFKEHFSKYRRPS